MKMKTKIYAAYGSNMNLLQMARRCPRARVIDIGMLKNYKLTFRGSSNGVANIESCQGREVPIVLWQITPTCEVALDRYEGFPNLYTKQDIEVETKNGIVKAMVYVMTERYEKMPAEPSEHYYAVIAEGYEDNGLPLDALDDAYGECIKEIGGAW